MISRSAKYAWPEPPIAITNDVTGEVVYDHAMFEVRRYDIAASIVSVYWGVRYRIPPCCIVAYAWWLFWHGAPAFRYWGQHGFDSKGLEYVPCHRHAPRDAG